MLKLTPEQNDTLTELINIGVGAAASTLNELLQTHISLKVPRIFLCSLDQVAAEISEEMSQRTSIVTLPFDGPVSGSSSLLFPAESAAKLAGIISNEDDEDEDSDLLKEGILMEVGNIVLNAMMGSLGNIFELQISYSFPNYLEDIPDNILQKITPSTESACLFAQATFEIREFKIAGHILLVFNLVSFEKLLELVDSLQTDVA